MTRKKFRKEKTKKSHEKQNLPTQPVLHEQHIVQGTSVQDLNP
jgi:hypothetical protein